MTRRQVRRAALIASLAYPVVEALGRTYRWKVDGYQHYESLVKEGVPPIFAFWHGRILPATCFWRDRDIVVMTSENFDGEWIARIIERFGYRAARGSTSRGGRRALAQLRRDVRAGRPAAFTLDGPRGPACVAQPGAVWLARLTGSPILPFHIESTRAWRVKSWDRSMVPWPFSVVTVAIGRPLDVSRDADEVEMERACVTLEHTLEKLTTRAREMGRMS